MNETDPASPAADAPITPARFAELVLVERKAFETAVTLRAWNDPAFVEQLAQDPIGAINAAFGLELRADLNIQVHHESPTTLHLALPPMPVIPAESNELTDDDLERVAGGGLALSASIVSAATGVSVTVSAVSALSAVSTVVTAVGTVRATKNL